jgi:hypothetical protein
VLALEQQVTNVVPTEHIHYWSTFGLERKFLRQHGTTRTMELCSMQMIAAVLIVAKQDNLLPQNILDSRTDHSRGIPTIQ